MAPGRRPPAGQGALFEVAGIGPTASGKVAAQRAFRRDNPAVIDWPGGIRPWDPRDEADTQLGWQFPYVTPRRAYQIRREIEHG